MEVSLIKNPRIHPHLYLRLKLFRVFLLRLEHLLEERQAVAFGRFRVVDVVLLQPPDIIQRHMERLKQVVIDVLHNKLMKNKLAKVYQKYKIGACA